MKPLQQPLSPSPLKERGIKVEDSSRGEVENSLPTYPGESKKTKREVEPLFIDFISPFKIKSDIPDNLEKKFDL